MDGWSICQLTPLFLDGLKALDKLISEKLAGFQHVYVIVAYIEENLQPIHVKNVYIIIASSRRGRWKEGKEVREVRGVSDQGGVTRLESNFLLLVHTIKPKDTRKSY